MRSQVYSWRLTPDRKAKLADAAKREGKTIAQLLEQATDDLLVARDSEDAEQQTAWQAKMRKHIGALNGEDLPDSTRLKEVVRARVLEKHRSRGQ